MSRKSTKHPFLGVLTNILHHENKINKSYFAHCTFAQGKIFGIVKHYTIGKFINDLHPY